MNELELSLEDSPVLANLLRQAQLYFMINLNLSVPGTIQFFQYLSEFFTEQLGWKVEYRNPEPEGYADFVIVYTDEQADALMVWKLANL